MRRTRWCLKGSLRTLNMAVSVTGILMIIYALWLLKKWDEGFAQLSTSVPPEPWFILAMLGVGMVVFLTTICGYMAVNRSNSTLYIYIATIFSLVLLQGGVIVIIFFNMNLESKLNALIGEKHTKFKQFIVFHLYMCRWVITIVLVAQVNLVILAVILCVVGAEPINPSQSELLAQVPDFRYSFLIPPNSYVIDSDNNISFTEEVDASRTTRSKLLQILCG